MCVCVCVRSCVLTEVCWSMNAPLAIKALTPARWPAREAITKAVKLFCILCVRATMSQSNCMLTLFRVTWLSPFTFRGFIYLHSHSYPYANTERHPRPNIYPVFVIGISAVVQHCLHQCGHMSFFCGY